MQTQLQLGNKKNRANVPFYTPPPRLYGQTPSEIIKEARAAVMTVPTIGIKPVFTNRPFTPKDNERTLFGNVRKKDKRPPSSFSLKNLATLETSSQVKLPSIDFASNRTAYSIFKFPNNLSLDNLNEDYDAKALDNAAGESFKKLPAWKKSHSCPKEGRMVKAASFSEISYPILGTKTSEWEVYDSIKMGDLMLKPGLKKGKNSQRYSIRLTAINTLPQSTENADSIGEVNNDKATYLKSGLSNELHNFKKALVRHEIEKKGNIVVEPISNPCGIYKSISLPETGCHDNEKDNLIKPIESCKQKSEKSEKSIEKTEEYSNNLEVSNKNQNNSMTKEIFEKSISTEIKSDYLLLSNEESKKFKVKTEKAIIPQEILELYQTAEYYGIDLQNHGNERKIKGNSCFIETKKFNNHDNRNLKEYSFSTIDQNSEKKLEVKNKNNKKTEQENGVETFKLTKYSPTNSGGTKLAVNREENNSNFYEKENESIKRKGENDQPTDLEVEERMYKNEPWDLFWQNCYYKSQRKENIEVEPPVRTNSQDCTVFNSLPHLINKITELLKIGDNLKIYEANCLLYETLKENHLSLDELLRKKLLAALSLFTDNENPEVLLSLAKLLFYLKIDSCLSVACKMVFKVARCDKNDHLFLNEKDFLELFMEGIGRASPLDCAESCIYGYGALKFLTMNHNILSRTLHLGALDLMILHLKLINTACIENGNVAEQTHQALFQLTGVLRHVAAGEGALPLFITTNCISVICKNLELFQKDEDIVTNISRTLSLVSTDESVTQVLMTVENILGTIIELMNKYKENDKILIRLSFCVGNIVEHSDLARIQLLRNETSMSVLLNLLKFFIDKDLEISLNKNSTIDLNPEIIDDIIVKVIRIIANMSMNPIVGSNLSPVANEKKSLELSQLLSLLLMKKDPGIALLATLGCLNNVSYYCNSHTALLDITQGIERVLGLPSEECQAEAARVLGNLTRHKEIRKLILKTGGVNHLINLVSSKNQEVVRCACGALVNILLDSEGRQQFIVAKGIDRLVNAIELYSGDWSLASLAGRAIWNSCADDVSSAAVHNNVEQLLNTLATSLEEENWNDGDAAWEEFASIATDLLEKINLHFESV